MLYNIIYAWPLKFCSGLFRLMQCRLKSVKAVKMAHPSQFCSQSLYPHRTVPTSVDSRSCLSRWPLVQFCHQCKLKIQLKIALSANTIKRIIHLPYSFIQLLFFPCQLPQQLSILTRMSQPGHHHYLWVCHCRLVRIGNSHLRQGTQYSRWCQASKMEIAASLVLLEDE